MATVIYGLCYYFYQQKINNAKFNFKHFALIMLKLLGWAMLAIGITAFMLAPVGYGMLNSARGESKGILDLSISWLGSVIIGSLLPIGVPSYCMIGLNIFIVILAFHFVANANNEYRSLFIIFVICAFLPLVAYIFNAFNYSAGRWYFVLIFVAIVCAGFGLSNTIDQNVDTHKTQKWVIGFIALALAIGIMYLVGKLLIAFNCNYIGAIIILFVLANVCIVGIVFAIKKIKPIKLKLNPIIMTILLLVSSIVLPFAYNIVYSGQFDDGTIYNGLITTDEQWVANTNKGTFYRVDTARASIYKDSYNNSSINNEYMSTHSYNSCSNGNVYEFLTETALTSEVSTLGIAGFDSRVAYQSLFNVNYYLAKDSLIPYGYSKVDTTNNVYENSNVLSLGTVYRNVVSEDTFKSTSIAERGNLMLEALVLEDESKSNYEYTNVNRPINAEPEFTNCEIKDGRIVAKAGAKISYTLTGIGNSEVYLSLNGFNYNFDTNKGKLSKLVNGISEANISINVLDRELGINLVDKGSVRYTGNNNYLYNLGYYTDDSTTVTISLDEGEYTYEDISFVAYDMAEYQSNIDTLRQGEEFILNDFDGFNGNTLSGSINMNSQGYLFLSIPYSTGWTAYVDGEEVDLLKANIGFMALDLDAGEHEIKLVYDTPLLKVGSIISVVSIIALIGSVIIIEVKIYKKREEDN